MALGTLQGSNLKAMNNIAKQGCQTHCGNITVPYPFGIGEDTGCALDKEFYLTCNTTNETSTLFLGSSTIDIVNISDSEFRTTTGVAYRCYDRNGIVSGEFNWWTRLNSALTFSEKNKFTVIGCDDYALITGREGDHYSSGCFGLCSNLSSVTDGECSGKGCCKTSITKGLQFYNVTLDSFQNHKDVWSINRCGLAFLGEENTFRFGGNSDLNNSADLFRRVQSSVLVVIDWVIGRDRNCSQATECKENSECHDADVGGYHCRCKQGYEGNPYLDQGCRDIDECKDPEKYPCHGVCFNTPGNYTCKCKKGYSGDATIQGGCQRKPFQTLLFSLGIGLSLLTILIGLSLLYIMAKKRKLAKLKEKFFEQNGGALLTEKLKSKGGTGLGSVNIFGVKELEAATDNFAEGKILGKGGNGIVYEGTLPDKRVVAIKKSQKLDKEQKEQFINEMVILTQINHTNVVQLLGFCLETDVPLLAYEFVSNNTLHYHIHYRKSGVERLSWASRLRIAHEAAGALAYLHTDARMSIIHRDVKSTNILLDDNFTTKIADFGASRLVPLGHDQVVTLVQGTFGYLDPEYFHTGELTDKSDVYSFGVVLAELLTGQQPLNMERDTKVRNLATYFVKSMQENTFVNILEHGLVNEAPYEQLKAISELVCRCLNQLGAKRPSMKEVTMELETWRKSGKHPWVSEDKYQEMSSLMIEMEPTELYTGSLLCLIVIHSEEVPATLLKCMT
ncbi:wall-associated receptor kinase 2-like protein [Tanacetum coccineum]